MEISEFGCVAAILLSSVPKGQNMPRIVQAKLFRINLFIEEMINSKKYSNCLDFIKFIGVDQNK